MTVMHQKLDSQIANALVGYSMQTNDTPWSDVANTAIDNDAFLTKYEWAAQIDLADAEYQIYNIPLETNAIVGPAHQGILLTSAFGQQLFLPDPSLPPNVWAGPIEYTLLSLGSRAVGFIIHNAGTSVYDQQQEFSLQPVVADPYKLTGTIFRGMRPAFLLTGSEMFRSSFKSIQSPDPNSETTSVSIRLKNEASESSPLAKKIRSVHKRAALDLDARDTAVRAVDDAIAFAKQSIPNASPSVMLSDEGVVMLQWRKSDSGILLVFTGDGTATVSIKEPGGRYTTNSKEFSIADGLPTKFKAAIDGFAAS